MTHFTLYKQPDQMNCGATCLRMIAKHYGRVVSLEKLQKLSETNRSGTSLKNISNAAERIGFRTLGVKVDFNKLKEDAPLPYIVHWKQNHFVVVYKIKNNLIYVADPAHGLLKYSIRDFIDSWIGKTADETTAEGIVLLLEPTPRLQRTEDDDIETKKGFSFLYRHLFRYKKFIFQLALGLLAGSLLQLIFPFLTQSKKGRLQKREGYTISRVGFTMYFLCSCVRMLNNCIKDVFPQPVVQHFPKLRLIQKLSMMMVIRKFTMSK